MNLSQHDLRAVAAAFDFRGDFVSGEPYGSGHINDTYAVVFDQAGARVRYILQRINHNIFRDPASLMENVRRVTEHQKRKLGEAGASDASRRALTIVPALDGASHHRDAGGNVWRCYLFIEGASTHDLIETERQAEEAARAFGRFQQQLADIPNGRLVETIPNFHNTPWRFSMFEEAVAKDAKNRAAGVKAEIEFALARKGDCSRLIDLHKAGRIPERVTHNDTKLNNVMLDNGTGEGICVIDLDTVMPGFSLFDFGDMVRTATNSGGEDERDLPKVNVRLNMFEALLRGFLGAARETLTRDEIDQLPFGGRLMTFECGIRFLADHLNGDTYFRIHREGHNLDRCRTQFRLVRQMEEQEPGMLKMVDRYR
jgi:hypothetical protein